MTKRTKKSVGTRRRKTRRNFRKKTLRHKKYRNKKFRHRKTKKGYARGSDDEADAVGQSSAIRSLLRADEETKEEEKEEEEEEEECAICGLPFSNEENGPVITTPCGHKFHKMCLCKWCHRGTCPICRANIRNTTCDQYCKYYLKIELISKAFSPQNPSTNVVILMLLEEMMEVVNPLRNNITAGWRARLETELPIVKDAIKTLLRNPALDLTRINLRHPRRPINEMFVYVIESEDPELIDLYLNKPNPGLTDEIIRDSKVSIRDMDKFAAVIEKMKNPEIRGNFPNVVNFDKENADEMFDRGLRARDIEVMRQALNMPDINLTKALCLMINKYHEDNNDEDDDDEDDDDEETKEEDIPENSRFTGNSLRRLKDEIILDPAFDPFAMCIDINMSSKSILFTAIVNGDGKTIDALLENPRLQEGFTNSMLADLRENAYRSDNAVNKKLFKKIIDYMKKKVNKPKFPNMNFTRTAFSIFTGGK